MDANQPDAEQLGHLPETRSCGPKLVRVEEELLTQALVNLVENALRCRPSGTRTGVHVQREAGHIELTADDTGRALQPRTCHS